MELEKRHIKIIITPIAFWGNGYPETDERTPGFSRVFGKGRATANDTAIRAQERYLGQLFTHVNPYTHHTYTDDPDVLAVELNNEPSHSGPKAGVTGYINRLAVAIRSVGWTKPLYYNIAQSPYYAEAVANAHIDGVSFQWYPTGLVSGSELRGNFLPNVDRYAIPFDTIPAFSSKSRMVYEFETADVLQSYMYPAVARSFRTAGFQWATQFAYDPMALGYANTEYQTHYLSLPFTPGKAISILIASEVFHTQPRGKSYDAYPMDSVFGAFHVSYREDLSEMNTAAKFFYTNNTTSRPVDAGALTNVAGVGSSPVVRYAGSGAYFLDRVTEGVWRLEVMPDAVHIRDPFERASPDKEVTRIQWDTNPMEIRLPDLGEGFSIKGLNTGNDYTGVAGAAGFSIRPGTYLLLRDGKTAPAGHPLIDGVIALNEFAAPQPHDTSVYVRHRPFGEVSAGSAFTLSADVVGLETGTISVQIGRLGGRSQVIPMTRQNATSFSVVIPAELATPGELDYRMIVRRGDEVVVFPGGWKGDPFTWNNYHDDTWKTLVAADNGLLSIFDPTTDHDVRIYPGFRRGFKMEYTTGEAPGRLLLALSGTDNAGPPGDPMIGFQYDFAAKLRGRRPERASFDRLVVRARSLQPVRAKITLTDGDAYSYSAYIMLGSDLQDIPVPLNDMKPDSSLLMPRPYPGFQPLWFIAGGTPPPFSLGAMEKVQLTIEGGQGSNSVEVASVCLQKRK
jgi:hypothetical protein